ncbi:endo-1,4-beta-xylanase [Duncaniella freteri]|uniref:endo-1,4-beta-xylanase n=1 Tax=Duncaniella freteri TaxID=2530391 RepID=UPI002576F75C|nr:endo-1,4-beta-xylanase [Duncaniella freteri]
MALGVRDINSEAARKLAADNFNCIVAENCMKSAEIHPEEDVYDFTDADKFVEFGVKNNMKIIGHCLIWHSQCPRWFCHDEKGNLVSPEVLKRRMKEHITTVMQRYKGKIHGWDVVNEAIENDGSWRNSDFYKILGAEFIPLAFQYAHEADPDAQLYYNDYSMDAEGKRNTVVSLIRDLKKRGLRIDAVGMQSHVGLHEPTIDEYEKSLLAFVAEGVHVMAAYFRLFMPVPIYRILPNMMSALTLIATVCQRRCSLNGISVSETFSICMTSIPMCLTVSPYGGSLMRHHGRTISR